jgi:S1-C subfamily serine protease
MLTQSKSIVSIESKKNKSFGTGFVIHNTSTGSYLVTAAHVIDKVIVPMINQQEAKVIAQGETIDLAILYLEGIILEPLPLQINNCNTLEVSVVGFSHFDQENMQKNIIKSILYRESIELHSYRNKNSSVVKKILATEYYHFEHGNSGSPVFCNEGENVIAIVGHKERNNIAYAINVASIKKIWKDAPNTIFKNYQAPIKKSKIPYYLVIVPSFIFALYLIMGSTLISLVKLLQS